MSSWFFDRKVFSTDFQFPDYYLSVTWRDLLSRKKRWQHEKKYGREQPGVKPWGYSSRDKNAGLIARVDKSGIISTASSDFLHGILYMNGKILCASHHEMILYSLDLESSYRFASFPQFNALHSIRKTRSGLLIASSGTDSILELSKDGKDILWDWWAGEHGFEKDEFGDMRLIDKQADHRYFEYDTWLHTAHVNAAVELSEKELLATFFMSGILGKIDRLSGNVTPILSGLKRPHAVRIYEQGGVSLADTANGVGLVGTIVNNDFILEKTLSIPSVWLQDFRKYADYWLAVDGEHSRVYAIDGDNNILGCDQFDPNWYLYEVETA